MLSITVTLGAQAIDNGIGITPPMGWRSWNCYAGDIDDAKMRKVVDAMVSKKRMVDGVPTSLLDIGYDHCGIDDGWQSCGAGIHGSFHDAQGNPILNLTSFPSMKDLVDYSHSKNMKMGWYANNCFCRENDYPNPGLVYQGDVNFMTKSGFDGIKLDDCGMFKNLTLWSDLINATGHAAMIEDCHWGLTVPSFNGSQAKLAKSVVRDAKMRRGKGSFHTEDPDSSRLPHFDANNELWCPFNLYRTSADVYAEWNSVLHNLFSTIPFQDKDQPLSRPGCWAYPDMLETGNFRDFKMDRSHFGAWAIVSSPLILGLDLINDQVVDRVWDVITNKEVIAVNQQWAGHPGMFVKSWTPAGVKQKYMAPVKCDASNGKQIHWQYDDVKNVVRWVGTDLCWNAPDGGALTLLPCDGSKDQYFHYNPANTKDPDYANTFSNSNTNCVAVQGGGYDPAGHKNDLPGIVIGGCNAGDTTIEWFVHPANNSLTVNGSHCLEFLDDAPDPKMSPVMLWAKPQPNNAIALLASSPFKTTLPSVDVDLSWLNITGSVSVRDLWNKTDLPDATSTLTVDPMESYDSRFYLIKPKTDK
jgi:hypothetical protein